MGPACHNAMVPHISPSWLRHGIPVYYSGMGQSRIYNIPYAHIAAYTAIALPKGTFWSHSHNVMVPHISPSWLRHGIRVYYSGMGQSRIYDMPYSHIATYASIALPKDTFWSPTAVTLWYHHISTFQLCHNANAVWLRLTYTFPCMSTSLYNVMVPSHQAISVIPWYSSIVLSMLLWYASASPIRPIAV